MTPMMLVTVLYVVFVIFCTIISSAWTSYYIGYVVSCRLVNGKAKFQIKFSGRLWTNFIQFGFFSVGILLEGKNRFLIPTEMIKTVLHLCQ